MPKINSEAKIVSIAIPTIIRRSFDYLLPKNILLSADLIGVRVEVPFSSTKKIGVIVNCVEHSRVESSKLKRITKILDAESTVSLDLLDVLGWAADYYQHALGDAISNALPTLLRKGGPTKLKIAALFRLTNSGLSADRNSIKRAPKQANLLNILKSHEQGLTAEQLNRVTENWRTPMKKLIERGWVKISEQEKWIASAPEMDKSSVSALNLNVQQQNAVETILKLLGAFSPFLLEGVTGSGKTEVYLRVIHEVMQSGSQCLVLVPEIALTPQLVERFQARFSVPIVALHSGLNDRERLNGWLLAKQGKAKVVIGTRSAVFTPFEKLGLIVVDEEHDASYKQQEGFRYSARDIAVRRAQQLDIPIILGSATPSLESLYNALQKKYQHLSLPERAGEAVHPEIKVLDVRSQAMQEGLSAQLLQKMRDHLGNGRQVMLFLNRRGFAPTLLCHDCGWVSVCHRCDSHMTMHMGRKRLRCHHCGAERAVDRQCPECESEELIPIGVGTERIEQTLTELFPDYEVVRIDRDTTRRKGALQKKLDQVHEGDAKILLGTQMLAKGHHFPNVTLVGIIDIDQGLFSVDFRATERMAQMIVQVAGRAGRAENPGEVLIQTHHPEHPLLQTLLAKGYDEFAKQALIERQQANLPPYSYIALLRAEAVDIQKPFQFLNDAKQAALQYNLSDVQLDGPVAAPMEKRAGRYRAQLLLTAEKRSQLHRLLKPWVLQLETLKSGRKVRWSLDVDPVDTY